jgi:hypothetical protein
MAHSLRRTKPTLIYDAANPANRLVAGELEARWNKALERMAEVENKVAAYEATKVAPVADPALLATLATDLKTIWTAPSTDARLKKRIIRTLIHEVIADIDPRAAEIVLVVHWIGGIHNEIRLPKRRRGNRGSASADLIAAVRQLALIANDDVIAGTLNRNGLVTGFGNRWTRVSESHHCARITVLPCTSPPMTGWNRGSTWARQRGFSMLLPKRSGWQLRPVRSRPSTPCLMVPGFSAAPLSRRHRRALLRSVRGRTRDTPRDRIHCRPAL